MSNKDILCFDIQSNRACRLVGIDVSKNLVHLFHENTYYDADIEHIIYAAKIEYPVLQLVTDGRQLLFGEKFVFQYNNINYDFTVRRQNVSFYGYTFYESAQHYEIFVTFLRTAFEQKKVYTSMQKVIKQPIIEQKELF